MYVDRARADVLKVARALEHLESSKSPVTAERTLRTAASVPIGLDRSDVQCEATEPLSVTGSDSIGCKTLSGSTSEGSKVCPPGILKVGSRRTSEEDRKKESVSDTKADGAEDEDASKAKETSLEMKSPDDDDSSFEVLKEETVSPSVETAQEAIEGHVVDKQSGTFRAEDIRISVIRPSPVKEMASRATNMTDKTKGDISESTSTSSIQVLDDGEDMIRASLSRDNMWFESAEDTPNTEVELQDLQSTQRRDSKDSEKDCEESLMPSRRQSEGLVTSKLLAESGSMDAVMDVRKTQQLSPLTVASDGGDKKGMKRAHSSASFELRAEKMAAAAVIIQGGSGRNTPQRRQSGPQTPIRSRHQSGLQTPMSAFSLLDTSSRSSVGEEGNPIIAKLHNTSCHQKCHFHGSFEVL